MDGPAFVGPIFNDIPVPRAVWLVSADHSNLLNFALDALEHDSRYRRAMGIFVLFKFVFFRRRRCPRRVRLAERARMAGPHINVRNDERHLCQHHPRALGGKINRLERTLAKIALAPVGNGHQLTGTTTVNTAASRLPISRPARLRESFWVFCRARLSAARVQPGGRNRASGVPGSYKAVPAQ